MQTFFQLFIKATLRKSKHIFIHIIQCFYVYFLSRGKPQILLPHKTSFHTRLPTAAAFCTLLLTILRRSEHRILIAKYFRCSKKDFSVTALQKARRFPSD